MPFSDLREQKKTKTNLSNAALASKMDPTTDMEKEVEMLLTAGGASETGLAEKEMEELKSKVAYKYMAGALSVSTLCVCVLFFLRACVFLCLYSCTNWI